MTSSITRIAAPPACPPTPKAGDLHAAQPTVANKPSPDLALEPRAGEQACLPSPPSVGCQYGHMMTLDRVAEDGKHLRMRRVLLMPQ